MAPTDPLVKLRFYATLRVKADREEDSCRAARLRDALEFLKRNYNADFNRHLDSCHIFVNQDNAAFLKGPGTRLKEGDVLHILPPTGGG